MKIIIAGGTGFIGQKLTDLLLSRGHEIVILTRKVIENSANVTYIQWLGNHTAPEHEIKHADAVINLAGVSINDGRWTAKHQQQIYDSRMTATDELLRIISLLPPSHKPSIFVNASAIGIYPASVSAVYTEESTATAEDFLGRTVLEWENRAQQLDKDHIRTVLMRFGVVLGDEGGALPLMALPYKMFIGGTVGSGTQYLLTN